MHIASVAEIKRELKHLEHEQLMQLCNRLAVFKKENKELMTYLLFDQKDESLWTAEILEEMEDDFSIINKRSVFYIKKSLRKIIRKIDKYSRISKNKTTEIELRTGFLYLLIQQKINFKRSRVLSNLFMNQIKKIDKIILKLHEDLQYDYNERLETIREHV